MCKARDSRSVRVWESWETAIAPNPTVPQCAVVLRTQVPAYLGKALSSGICKGVSLWDG